MDGLSHGPQGAIVFALSLSVAQNKLHKSFDMVYRCSANSLDMVAPTQIRNYLWVFLMILKHHTRRYSYSTGFDALWQGPETAVIDTFDSSQDLSFTYQSLSATN